MKNDKFERRAYTFDIRAEQTDEYGVIEGRAIVYNSVSDMGYFDEIIASGWIVLWTNPKTATNNYQVRVNAYWDIE